MSTLRIVIPITPKPKGSVRLSKGRAYNPSAKGMTIITNYIKAYLDKNPMPLMRGPLLVVMHLVLPALKYVGTEKRRQQNYRPCTRRPDGDNLEKFLNDSLNGVVWQDDAQICWMIRSKSITAAKTGYTILYVTEIEDTMPDYKAILKTIEENINIEHEETNGDD